MDLSLMGWVGYAIFTLVVVWVIFLGGAEGLAKLNASRRDRIAPDKLELSDFIESIPLYLQIGAGVGWVIITLMVFVGEEKAKRGPLGFLFKLIDLLP